MNVLSLFDGMSCGQIALKQLGIQVDRYVSYEIDKYAIRTTMHNFPNTEQCGDVFDADFTQYEGFDLLCGGSPCTYWSIAQTKNRETVANGMGWELFSQYVRALREAKPKYFIYENNKSMSKEIRASIDDAFGFEAVLINSALVSAQNRQRLYWVGKRNADGTYSKVNIEQPEDRGILLKDILDGAAAWRDKAYTIDAHYYKTPGMYDPNKQHSYSRLQAAEPVIENADGKSYALTSTYYKLGQSEYEVAHNYEKHQRSMIAEPVCVASRGRNPDNLSDRTAGMPTQQHLEAHTDGKTNTLTSVSKDNLIAEPVDLYENKTVATACDSMVEKFGYIPEKFNPYNRSELIDKSPTLSTGSMVTRSCATLVHERVYECPKDCEILPCGNQCHAVPCEWDENGEPIKAVSCADGKIYTVYKVENGKITIKGKQYPIKLADGYYIIRKLTVSECKRLQTVPDWYDFTCVSNSQAYKMLGNGWTVEVIMHLIRRITDAT